MVRLIWRGAGSRELMAQGTGLRGRAGSRERGSGSMNQWISGSVGQWIGGSVCLWISGSVCREQRTDNMSLSII